MGARGILTALALAAAPLAGQEPPSGDSVVYYTLSPTVGVMRSADLDLDLLHVEILQVAPGRPGGRITAGTVREAVAGGALFVDAEIGPALAIPVTRGAMLVPAGTLVLGVGDATAWGFAAGAGLLVEPAGRAVLRLHAGRRWYRTAGEWYGLTTVSAGLGVRLGRR